ncbi:MAG: hypothetical protein HRU19_10660 [Pseudobacteriovorax sp.]|nr:hypothetical protein [Pseudobacteriovorax sp.]
MNVFVCAVLAFSLQLLPSFTVFAKESKPKIPIILPDWADQSTPLLGNEPVYIVPRIQTRLKRFLKNRANPVAAVMLVSVKTGEVLAMVQGDDPSNWGGHHNTNLHPNFPAASLFKTVVAAATLETMDFDSLEKDTLDGGCARVSPKGHWMRNDIKGRKFRINLRRAYGSSCNGFFARLAINEIGLGPILNMAEKFGWADKPVDADFTIPVSPMSAPNPKTSSAHQVGEFAAGFGYVGLSVAHASWQMLAIANAGYAKPLKLFQNSDDDAYPGPIPHIQLFSKETADELLSIMDATVLGGTASSSFRRRGFRKIRSQIGGKTGTLTGYYPKGVTTWFAGVYPLEKPEVVVASVVVLKDLWHVKASGLAAEAVKAYLDDKKSANLAKSKQKKTLKN